MSMRFNTPVFRPQDNKGRTLPGAQLFFYENYSTTPKTTYANVALTNPNPHPIIADGAGKFTDIFLGIGDYRVILTDRKGQILWDRNDVSTNDLTEDVINDIERQLDEVLNQYRMQYLGEYGVADPDLEKTFTVPNAQYVEFNGFAYWTIPGTALPYTTDSVTYPDPANDPNLTIAPNVTFGYVDSVSNAGDSQLARGNIWPLSGQDSLVLGAQSSNIPSGISRLNVSTGEGNTGGVELLYLWSPSGDFSGSAQTITNITQNSLGGYDVVTNIQTYEFLNEANFIFRKELDVRGWGGSGDYFLPGDVVNPSPTDNTPAFQAASDYVQSLNIFVSPTSRPAIQGPAVKAESGQTYFCSGQVTFFCDVDMTGSVIATDNVTDSCFRFEGGWFYISNLPSFIQTEKPATTWIGVENSVAVEAYNCSRSTFYLDTINDFGTALLLTGDSNQCSYNTFFFNYFEDNKVGIRFNVINAPSGFANENKFYNGTIRINSNNAPDATGSRYVLTDPTSNGNLFMHVTMEGGTVEYAVEEKGAQNLYLHCRWELAATTSVKVLFNSDTGRRKNVIAYGYAVEYLVIEYAGAASPSSMRNEIIDSGWHTFAPQGSDNRQGRICQNVNSNSAPIDRFFSLTEELPNVDPADYLMEHTPVALRGKRDTDSNPRVELDYTNGRVKCGDGAGAFTEIYRASGRTFIAGTQSWEPDVDNTTDIGTGALRIKTIYLVNAPSVTSDETLKTQLEDISEAEKRVSDKIKIKKFKYLDRIELKGESEARVHFGVGAQSVIAAFESEGLNAFDYALIRKIEEPEQLDEDGNKISESVSRYEIVYEELLAFKISCM